MKQLNLQYNISGNEAYMLTDINKYDHRLQYMVVLCDH